RPPAPRLLSVRLLRLLRAGGGACSTCAGSGGAAVSSTASACPLPCSSAPFSPGLGRRLRRRPPRRANSPRVGETFTLASASANDSSALAPPSVALVAFVSSVAALPRFVARPLPAVPFDADFLLAFLLAPLVALARLRFGAASSVAAASIAALFLPFAAPRVRAPLVAGRASTAFSSSLTRSNACGAPVAVG